MPKLDNVELGAAVFQSVFYLWTLKYKFHLIPMSQNDFFSYNQLLGYTSYILTLVQTPNFLNSSVNLDHFLYCNIFCTSLSSNF